MNRIAQFSKVSYLQFAKDWKNTFESYDDEAILKIYNNIKLPKRATSGSAGYDFYSPLSFTLKPSESVKIPTGIRVKINDGWFLSCYPRSGLGFMYRLQLNNTVGIIDSDYFNSSNEGHIMIKLTNASVEDLTLELSEGVAFAQGIFTEYGITFDDEASGVRDGGFGSTGI